jgi:hypothetical protein
MQFVDPSEIQQALDNHQTLHLSPQLFVDGPVSVVPDHELMITAIPVVEDRTRTFDQCLPNGQQGTPAGAWTFATLMKAIACSTGTQNCTTAAAENVLLSMLASWQHPKTALSEVARVSGKSNNQRLIKESNNQKESQASENSVGTIPSQAFTILGSNGTTTGTVHGPSSIILF